MHHTTAYQIRKPSLPRGLRRSGLRSAAAPSTSQYARGAALATVLAALAFAGVPSLASAQSLNSVNITTEASSKYLVLDVNGASTTPGPPVIPWFGNGGSNQRWNFVQLPDGNEQIVNQNSGMCLTTDGVAGHRVYQWPCEASNPHQEWKGSLISAWYAGQHPLQNPASGLMLDVEGDHWWAGANIITWYPNGTDGELFSYWQL